MLRATAGLTVGALALGSITGSATARIAEFENLTVDSSSNTIVDESDETFKIRGLNVADPKRVYRTRFLRGKTPIQIVDMLTDTAAGWYPRAIRVPAQPQDIGEHPMGHTGPRYEPGELESPDAVARNRRKMRPAQPPAFTRSQLLQYLEDYYDPIVDRCEERGVYCIVDYHRHWHEQPPGEEAPLFAENHLPYDSEYTNYWAYNTYEDDLVRFGEDTPASWGWIDQQYIDVGTPGFPDWTGLLGADDIPETPYAYEYWQVNEPLLQEVLTFWEVVADRYGDRDHVLFEPYNEPTEPAIWGPVEGCAAFKQEPLWETFVFDFMGPILDEIRQHQPERVLLTGVPGWCQSLQGLHWLDFEQAGWDNIAVTWHNYAGHDVSQVHNWLNDTNYQSPEAVEAEKNRVLSDPSLPLPDSVDMPECWGWEGYEAGGLQNAMDFHPVVVTEFGWIDDTAFVGGVHGTTTEYGAPFLEAMESDDRISWIAWCADVRWLPKLFEYPDAPDEGALDLVNDNFYDTPLDDLPQPCPDPPCEWELLGGENSGEYIRDRLDWYREDLVPVDLVTEEPPPPCRDGIEVGRYCATDPNGDGKYTDVNGNGGNDLDDIVAFFEHMNGEGVQNDVSAFDFNENGDVDFDDVVSLFEGV